MAKYLLIDGSNIAHASNAAKNKLKVGDTEVQAIYVFLRSLRHMLSVYSNTIPVVLWDGVSWRNMKFPEYKENRNPKETKSSKIQHEARISTRQQIPAIKKALELLGIAQVFSHNMEADDLAAILNDRYVNAGHSCVLVSGDKDWIQLVGPNTIWFDPIRDRKIRQGDLMEQFGVKNVSQFVEMKALMGDLGDNIAGVGGIGEKGAVEFLEKYNSIADFSNMILDKTIDPKTLPKKFRTFAESEEKQIIFGRNVMLMDLRTTERPAPIGMSINKGEASADRFNKYCKKLAFQSIYSNLKDWLCVFPNFKADQKEQ